MIGHNFQAIEFGETIRNQQKKETQLETGNSSVANTKEIFRKRQIKRRYPKVLRI